MIQTIQFQKRGGGTVTGALALPRSGERAPGILIAHEWWGLNDNIRSLAERFAAEGFVALAPDLYGGEVTDNPERAGALANAMKTAEAMDILAGGFEYLAHSDRCSGRIGVTGFCLGGAMALAAGCNVAGLSAILPFYGLPMPQHVDWTRVTAPIQGHYAEHDTYVSPDKARATFEAIAAAGKQVELYFYAAGHAFMREGDPSAYNEPAARLAWDRAMAFLRKNLAPSVSANG